MHAVSPTQYRLPMCWLGRGRTRELVLRIEVAFLALVVGFGLATLCHRRLQIQYFSAPLTENVPLQPRLELSRRPAPPASSFAVPKKVSSPLVPGYTFAGVGNLPGDDATCPGDGPRRPEGALGSMCQPGNVSVHQCSQACEQLESCLGFVWSPRPPWSKYSECYLKGSCPLGRLQAMSNKAPMHRPELPRHLIGRDGPKWGSPRRGLALIDASGEPAGRSLNHPLLSYLDSGCVLLTAASLGRRTASSAPVSAATSG